jgi:competence protein ComEC
MLSPRNIIPNAIRDAVVAWDGLVTTKIIELCTQLEEARKQPFHYLSHMHFRAIGTGSALILLLRRFILFLSVGLPLAPAALARSQQPLRIYFIDVEGGQSTLIVTPAKQSVLIDTGFAGERDADRILQAAKAAGIKQIDYVFITHYHQDHVGGVADLLKKMKVGVFVDHGENQEDSDAAKRSYADYVAAIKHNVRAVLRPGEGVPIKGITLQVVAAAGDLITDPLPGAGEANIYCASEKQPPDDASENSRSLGVLISYGRFRFLDLGDLTEKKELELVCPNNLIGTADLYLATHHGGHPDNPRALVWALHPRVAVINNGSHKGGNPEAWQIIHDSPDLADLWQLHYAIDSDQAHNAAQASVANVDERSDGHYIEVEAGSDGKFSVRNSRNGLEKKYEK